MDGDSGGKGVSVRIIIEVANTKLGRSSEVGVLVACVCGWL